jgi:hypothetical protein
VPPTDDLPEDDGDDPDDDLVDDRPPADPFLLAAGGIAVVLRILAVVGLHPYRYVDSIDYDSLDFSGRGRRPWATPLLYRFAGEDPVRVFAQAAVGGLCWVVLASEVAALVVHRWAQRGAFVAILALGLTTSITNWDTAMLSESLAVSTTALLLAALLHAARVHTWRSAVLVALATLWWAFTRQNHTVLLGLLVATLLVVTAVQWRRERRFPRFTAALAGGVVVVALLAAVSYGRSPEIRRFNLAMVIGQRIITDQERLTWFVDHGMPLPDAAAPGQAIFPEPLLADDEFADWIADDGNRTYARFLLTHPWYSLTEPLEDFVADRPSYADPPRVDETMLSTAEAYGSARQVLPEQVDRLLWDPGGTGTLLLALIVVLAATAWSWRMHGWDERWLVPLLAIVLQWPALTVVWHASTAELGRLALISAVALRIGLLVQAALLIDTWLPPAAYGVPDGGEQEDSTTADQEDERRARG